MRVLHVCQPVDAGTPAVLLAYVAAQLAAGDDVAVAAPGDPLLERATALGAAVRRWEATRSPGRSVVGEVRALAAVCRDVRPDLVHLHSSKAGLAGRLAVRGRIPTVFQPHAWSFDAVTGPVARAALAWERMAVRWTAVTLCVGTDELGVGERAGTLAEHSLVVPNRVDPGPGPVPRDRAEARHRLRLDDSPLVVCVGRLAQQKGQLRLLASWQGVLARVPDARLVLVGDGPDRDRLGAAAARLPGVRLVGASADVATWYDAADVVAVPSRWEGLALVPLEAQARARSVVAARATGLTETVCPGTGAVVDADDPAVLADALATRLEAPELAAAEGARGRAVSEEAWAATGPADLHGVYALAGAG